MRYHMQTKQIVYVLNLIKYDLLGSEDSAICSLIIKMKPQLNMFMLYNVTLHSMCRWAEHVSKVESQVIHKEL